jgi:cation transport ATPase
MNQYEMVVLIVFIVTLGRVLSGRRRTKTNAEVIQTAPDVIEDASRMQSEIKVLKDRIAVLERITTETNSAVALDREIEKLR